MRICSPCCNLSVGPGAVPLDGTRAMEQRMCLPTKKVTMELMKDYVRQILDEYKYHDHNEPNLTTVVFQINQVFFESYCKLCK